MLPLLKLVVIMLLGVKKFGTNPEIVVNFETRELIFPALAEPNVVELIEPPSIKDKSPENIFILPPLPELNAAERIELKTFTNEPDALMVSASIVISPPFPELKDVL